MKRNTQSISTKGFTSNITSNMTPNHSGLVDKCALHSVLFTKAVKIGYISSTSLSLTLITVPLGPGISHSQR